MWLRFTSVEPRFFWFHPHVSSIAGIWSSTVLSHWDMVSCSIRHLVWAVINSFLLHYFSEVVRSWLVYPFSSWNTMVPYWIPVSRQLFLLMINLIVEMLFEYNTVIDLFLVNNLPAKHTSFFYFNHHCWTQDSPGNFRIHRKYLWRKDEDADWDDKD